MAAFQNVIDKGYEKFALNNLLLDFKSKPNFIAYEPKLLDNLTLKLMKAKGNPILTWTIEDEKESYDEVDNINK